MKNIFSTKNPTLSGKLLGLFFIFPSLILFLTLILYPMIFGVRLSFLDANNLRGDGDFIGLGNYIYIFKTGIFWDALFKGVVWTVGSVALELVIGVVMAMLMNHDFYGRSLARGLILFPYLVPVVVATMVWRWMFNDLYGVINYLLNQMGIIDGSVLWLSSIPWAMLSVILVGAWRFFPFTTISALGRLQTIPKQLYEAATVDGANSWDRFWDITVVQLKDVLSVVILFRVIWAFNDFGTIYLLTGGGPVMSTRTLPLLVYELGFKIFRIGSGAAVAVIMMLIMSLFMVVYFRSALRQMETK
jgi:multiple sugar transport system permease protein